MQTLSGQRFLPESVRALVSEERVTLGRLRELLAAQGAVEEDIELLRQAEMDLDELFLLVVVGEFNSGKSSFINALVGKRILREGVTPTTAAITRLTYAPQHVERRDGPLVEVGYPLDLLRDVAIVDTPGTNAILREHEQITSHFVPRADLVLFVTSADRPFTETERQFIERIRTWGKKVVVVLNKADLLTTESDLQDQLIFVGQSVERLLGFSPEILPVSSRQALAAKEEADPEQRATLLRESRFDALERFVVQSLDERGRLQLKLGTPLGVAERISGTYMAAMREKLGLLAEDMALVESLEQQLAVYRADMLRDFDLRLTQIELILDQMLRRGLEYLDETLRLGRVLDLFRQEKLKEDFERIVVGDTGERIDRAAQELIDWMVDQDLRMWRTVTDQAERRRSQANTDGPAQRLAGGFEYDRRSLLGSLGQTARQVIQRHDHRREADQLAQSVRGAVTQGTLLEAGAVGLGAATIAVTTSAAVDVTGLFAASVLAGLGLWVIPRKRKQAREQFRARTEELRERLTSALREEFDRELTRSVQRIRDALAPYDRFVRGEHERTGRFGRDLEQLLTTLRTIRTRLEELRATPA